MAYGETGSGKTFTMYALMEHFLGHVASYSSETVDKVKLKLSCIEIAPTEGKEAMFDLLNKRKRV